jgi:hypothetical protein
VDRAYIYSTTLHCVYEVEGLTTEPGYYNATRYRCLDGPHGWVDSAGSWTTSGNILLQRCHAPLETLKAERDRAILERDVVSRDASRREQAANNRTARTISDLSAMQRRAVRAEAKLDAIRRELAG